MTNNNRHTNICNILSNTSCPQHIFSEIKNHFRQEINSARRFDKITNLNQLIRVLEKRDVVNTENVASLRYIAEILGRNDVINLIDTYDLRVQEAPVAIESVAIRVLPQPNSDPVQRVHEVICVEIGQKWKYLARKLQIPEGLIDELENRYQTISESVQEVLRYHRETCDERFWRVNLCEALRDARRTDLSSKVDKLCARYGLM